MKKPAPRNQPGAGEAIGKSKHSNTAPLSLPLIAPQPFRLLGNVVTTIVDERLAELGADPITLERYTALTPDMLIAASSTGWPLSVFMVEGGGDG